MAKNYIFLHIPNRARVNNLIRDNVMGLKILKQKCACGSSFVKIIWVPLSLKRSTTLGVRSSGRSHMTLLAYNLVKSHDWRKIKPYDGYCCMT